ncbi:integrase, partial [Acinetobacter johnsonii]|nr:integrase [Acinetobacter johnsonii]
KNDLRKLGISPSILDSRSRLAKEGLVFLDYEKLSSTGQKTTHPICYTTHEGIKIYCNYKLIQEVFYPFILINLGKSFFYMT